MGSWHEDMDRDQQEHPENWPDPPPDMPSSAMNSAEDMQAVANAHLHRVTIPDEPPPIPNDKVSIQDLVLQDIEERKQVGLERYGTLLQTGNGRDMLVDLYQELLDATMYVRGEIEERREHKQANLSKMVGYLCDELISWNGEGGYWAKKAQAILEEASRG